VELIVRRSTIAGRQVLSLRGELDLATLPRLYDALNAAVRENAQHTVVVDLDGVSACDDAGLGVLLGAAGRARQTVGDVVAVSSGGSLRERLSLTGFDRAVAVFASVSEATATSA